MAFVWTGKVFRNNRLSTVPLSIHVHAGGVIFLRINTALSKGIYDACKGDVHFRFGVDMTGHKVGLMFQSQDGKAWRKMHVDKYTRLFASIHASTLGINASDISGEYTDFHFDKDAQLWLADIRKRQPLKG